MMNEVMHRNSTFIKQMDVVNGHTQLAFLVNFGRTSSVWMDG